MTGELMHLPMHASRLLFAASERGGLWDGLGNPVVLITLIIFGCLIAGCAVDYWYKLRRAEIEAAVRESELALKRDMLQRGMSAQEIQMVLGSSQETGKKGFWSKKWFCSTGAGESTPDVSKT